MKKIHLSLFYLICLIVGFANVTHAQPKSNSKYYQYYNDWRDCIVNVLKNRVSASPYQDITPIDIDKEDLDQNKNEFAGINRDGYQFTLVLKTKVRSDVAATGERKYFCEPNSEYNVEFFEILNINDTKIYRENSLRSEVININPTVNPKYPYAARTWVDELDTCAWKLLEKQIAISPFPDLKIDSIELPMLHFLEWGSKYRYYYEATDKAGEQFTGKIDILWNTHRQEDALSGKRSYSYKICGLNKNPIIVSYPEHVDNYNFYIQNAADEVVFMTMKPFSYRRGGNSVFDFPK